VRTVDEVAAGITPQQEAAAAQAPLEGGEQDVDRHEERRVGGPMALSVDPLLPPRVPSAGSDDDMDMRMYPKIAALGVEDGQWPG